MKRLLSIILNFGIFLLLVLFICILYYYQILSKDVYSVLKIIIGICFFIGNGYLIERGNVKVRYLRGFCLSSIFILFSIFISLFKHSFSYPLLLYYGIVLFSTLFGSFLKRQKNRLK